MAEYDYAGYRKTYREKHPDRILESRKRYNLKNKEQVRKDKRRYKKAHPEKTSAGWAVKKALASGKLVRPETCPKCGNLGTIVGHHYDYQKKLDVLWLCDSCHKEIHKTPGDNLA